MKLNHTDNWDMLTSVHWNEGLGFRFRVSALDAARNQKTGVPVSDAWPETDLAMSQLRLLPESALDAARSPLSDTWYEPLGQGPHY